MIVSKPKRSTLISLSLFLILVAALTAATFNSISNSENIYWYHYLFLAILIPTGLAVLIKTLFSYKTTSIGKGKIAIHHPVKLKKKEYDIKDITQWREVTINTASGLYQQLEINFVNNDRLTLGKQEHSNYDKVIAYLQQKASRKKIK